jgi:ATP-binding cassette subfamily C exporter for protease/lipase
MKSAQFFKRSELTSTLWLFRREFLLVGALSLIANVLMLSPTLYMLQVYDRVLSSQSEVTLLAMSLLTLCLFAVMALVEWLRSQVLVGTGLRLDERLGTLVFNASFEAQLSPANPAGPAGQNPARAFSDLLQIRQFLTGSGVLAFFDAPWTPIYLAILFFLHPWLGLLGLLFALLQAGQAWFGHQRSLTPSEAAAEAWAEAGSFLQDKLRNAEVLEAMGMIGKLQARWGQRHHTALARTAVAQHLTHRITAVSKFIRYSQQSLVLGAGALLVIDGQLSPGGMIAANLLMSRALAPIEQIVGGWRQFIGMRAAFARLEQLLLKHSPRDPAFKRVPPTGNLSLQQVSAHASNRPTPILQNINLQVRAGTVTAILGPSGSGKSTLARVLVGIWPQMSGAVLLDGLPIEGWNRLELGPHIGYLPQDVALLEGSIAENIARFGTVDPGQVIAAAQDTGLHEMILRFPKGYDTPIGEAGRLLSGGQRQRIGLARAIYGDPKLVVLDEPNANLDELGEAALFKTVEGLKAQGKTVFLITHRPAAVAVADRLLILNNGQLQTEGPREAVLAALRAAREGPQAAANPVVPVPHLAALPV